MIASFEHKYIFVKTAKTAGTSMEIALSTFTGEKDIITPIAAVDELKRLENPRARLPQNYCPYPQIEERYRAIVRSGALKRIEKFQKRHFRNMDMFRNHMPAADIRFRVDREFFRTAFKFTIQRHPYDRLISLVHWKLRNAGKEKLEKKLNSGVKKILRKRALNNERFYTIDGEIAVDFFIRYEHLHEDLAAVEQKIGASNLGDALPHTKHGHRTDRRPPQDALTKRQKIRVRRQCKREFEAFGYEA